MRAEIGLLVILVLIAPAAPVWCDETASAVFSEAEDTDSGAPSMELLEFLGSWETDDGEWVDPDLLEDTLLPDQESSDE